MNPDTRKYVITFIVLAFAGFVLATAFMKPTNTKNSQTSTEASSASTNDGVSSEVQNEEQPAAPKTEQPSEKSETVQVLENKAKAIQAETEALLDDSQDAPIDRVLVARAPAGPMPEKPTSLGSLDVTKNPFQINFSQGSAGIESVIFSDFWTEARYRRQARQHRKNPEAYEAPDEQYRYALRQQAYNNTGAGNFDIPILAAFVLEIDGKRVTIFGNNWSQIAPGHFRCEIADKNTNKTILVLDRTFTLNDTGGYQLDLTQEVTNVSGQSHDVRWISYGPGDLDRDRGSFIEVRRFHFGYLMNTTRDPAQTSVQANGQMFERSAVLDQVLESQQMISSGSAPNAEDLDLWPNRDSLEQDLTLSWFGTTNRYFTIAVMSPFAPPEETSKSLIDSIESVRPTADTTVQAIDQVTFTELHGPIKSIAQGASADWNMGIYFGPLDRSILAEQEPYVALNLQRIIVYLMSGCCTFCTFTWLADFLVIFLAMLHDNVVFDWGLAIVVLVVIVRTLLHPLMKRGQIQMQRMGKLMSELKPELDALQKKYKSDPSRMQQEQRRLFMERGVNPLGCVGGMLPTFLQMPIWIALYAVLFFAFELRQEAAFFGLFQLVENWQFLGDLSRPDHFFEFTRPFNIYITDLTGINVLPLLMGFMFFLQQKYMSPPPSPNTTPEQLQQQKIMKVMMVVLFPVMLYQAPSGLTLYILTSTCIGIIEGRRVRKLVEKMDFSAPVKGKNGAANGKKPKDRAGRFFADKMEEARKKQEQKRKGTQKSFKKRNK